MFRVAAAAQTAVVVKALRQALDDLLRRRANSSTAGGKERETLGSHNNKEGWTNGHHVAETNLDGRLLDTIANLLKESEK